MENGWMGFEGTSRAGHVMVKNAAATSGQDVTEETVTLLAPNCRRIVWDVKIPTHCQHRGKKYLTEFNYTE